MRALFRLWDGVFGSSLSERLPRRQRSDVEPATQEAPYTADSDDTQSVSSAQQFIDQIAHAGARNRTPVSGTDNILAAAPERHVFKTTTSATSTSSSAQTQSRRGKSRSQGTSTSPDNTRVLLPPPPLATAVQPRGTGASPQPFTCAPSPRASCYSMREG